VRDPSGRRAQSAAHQAKRLHVLIFDVVRPVRSRIDGAPRSRSSVGERPLHTRKVAGSIPAGTTT
jgi:hypothetical protein